MKMKKRGNIYGLKHKNIVYVKNIKEYKTKFSIIMENVIVNEMNEGEKIYRIDELYEKEFGDNRKMRIKASKVYFKKILEGVNYLHCKKVYDWGISVENIIIAKDGDVKIMDYGYSCINKNDYLYQSPEHIQYNNNVIDEITPKLCDIWSLGVVFLVLIIGKYPFSFSDERIGDLKKYLMELNDELLIELLENEIKEDEKLLDLLKCCFKIEDYDERSTTEQLLQHDFISKFEMIKPLEWKNVNLNDSQKHFKNGMKFCKEKRFKEAKESYEMSILIQPTSNVYYKLGCLLQINFKDYEEAEKYFRKAIEINPKNVRSLNALGFLYKNHFKNCNESKEFYLNAIEINPKYSISYLNLGVLYRSQKEFDKAKKCYMNAIEINPKFCDAYYNLAILYHTHYKDFDKAKSYYIKDLELSSKRSNSYLNLGALYQSTFKEYQKAKECYVKAIEINPLDYIIYSNLGVLLRDKLNEYEESKKFLLKSIEINPKYSTGYINLGILYQGKLKLNELAKDCYKKVIKLEPKISQLRKKARKRLKEISEQNL